MTAAHDYAHQNAQVFLNQLKDLIRIPSVSTLPEKKADMQRAAEWLAADMKRIGLEKVTILPTGGHPVVYGEWMGAGKDAPTILVYGHYDVQPAVMEDGWDHEPFDPIEKNGRLYARGSSDDKGQAFLQLKAAESLLANGGKSPVNLKFLIEGEEEIGSAHLGKFVADNRDMLMADACVISDTGIKDLQTPSICYSTRGLMYMEFEVFGPKQDLHSGGYGGIVHNPVQAAAEIISKLHNDDGSISVPGFYDDVLPLSEAERETLRANAPTADEYQSATGVPEFWGEADYALHERIGARPTLEINGFAGGFYGAGSKTVLPAKALVKVSCRLVANQAPQKIYELVRDHILKIAPPTVRVEVRLLSEGYPAITPLDSRAMQAASHAYEQVWGKKPFYERGGGTLPILADFQQQLNNIPIVLMGFGLSDDGAHGPNESFTIELFHKGIDTAIYFLQEMGASQ